MNIKIILAGLLLLTSIASQAQAIRKNYNEMTPEERYSYKIAIESMKSTFQQLGCLHEFYTQSHTDHNAHTQDYLLPWHRWFQYYTENLIKQAPTLNAEKLTIPYWDWREEYHDSNMTWHKNSLLGAINTTWNLRRRDFPNAIGFRNGYAGIHIKTLFEYTEGSESAFSNFNQDLDGIHGSIHNYVGQGLLESTSPSDPVFFFHHGFIDKLWQEWEDSRSSKTERRTKIDVTTVPLNPGKEACVVNGFIVENTHIADNFNPQNVINSRNQYFNDGKPEFESWYAYKKKLVLDGLGADHITSGIKNYHYVAYDRKTKLTQGKIYVGDLKKDSFNIIMQDNKGGFVIGANSKVKISTAESITFSPGFSTQRGSVLSAFITKLTWTESPTSNLRISNEPVVLGFENINALENSWNIYPNPNATGKVSFGKMAKKYTLMNVTGEIILQGNDEDVLDITQLNKGMYLLNLDNSIQKLIVQ